MKERRRASLETLYLASLAAVALLLAINFASHWISGKITWPVTKGLVQIQVIRGGVFVTWLDSARSGALPNAVWNSEFSNGVDAWPEANVSMWNKQVFFGCAFVGGNGYTTVRLPLLLFTMGLGLYCVWWYRHPHRQPRKHVGHCVTCGYDLRGSEGRCPKCGEPFPMYALKNTPPPALPTTLLKPDRNRARPTDDIARSAAKPTSSRATDRIS